MAQRINVVDLPEFGTAAYLDSEEAIAAYLTDILAAALSDIAVASGLIR